MFTKSWMGLPLLNLVIAAVVFSSTTASWAKEPCCSKCGCEKKVEKKLCLVRTYEEIEVPIYACQNERAFFPCKGMLKCEQYQCETIYELEKKCCCDGSCKGHGTQCDQCTGGCETGHCSEAGCDHCQSCTSCVLECCSHTKEGCKTIRAAKSTGNHCSKCIKQPTGETCKKLVPVVKWIAIPVCHKCCHK